MGREAREAKKRTNQARYIYVVVLHRILYPKAHGNGFSKKNYWFSPNLRDSPGTRPRTALEGPVSQFKLQGSRFRFPLAAASDPPSYLLFYQSLTLPHTNSRTQFRARTAEKARDPRKISRNVFVILITEIFEGFHKKWYSSPHLCSDWAQNG